MNVWTLSLLALAGVWLMVGAFCVGLVVAASRAERLREGLERSAGMGLDRRQEARVVAISLAPTRRSNERMH